MSWRKVPVTFPTEYERGGGDWLRAVSVDDREVLNWGVFGQSRQSVVASQRKGDPESSQTSRGCGLRTNQCIQRGDAYENSRSADVKSCQILRIEADAKYVIRMTRDSLHERSGAKVPKTDEEIASSSRKVVSIHT